MAAEWATRQVRPVHNNHMNSDIWQKFQTRDDDVIVTSWGKSGTTLTQQLIGQIISHGDPEYDAQANSPWMELRVMQPDTLDKLAALPADMRRVIKTHLPTTALPYSPKAKYVVVMRDGRDCVWSIHNHHIRMKQLLYDMVNETPGLVGDKFPPPNPDTRAYFLHWLRHDGKPFWPFFSYVRSWWAVRDAPNVLFVHFNNLRTDLRAEGQRISAFLGVAVPEGRWRDIAEHCSMDWMRAHADKAVPLAGVGWEDGAAGFVFKGTNGRWADTLTQEDVQEYEDKALQELGPECAQWLATGLPADPKSV